MSQTTSFETKVEILSTFHENYHDSGEFEDFFRVNDIGIPLAHFLANGFITDVTPDGAYYINHSFSNLMLELFEEDKDVGAKSLEDLELML